MVVTLFFKYIDIVSCPIWRMDGCHSKTLQETYYIVFYCIILYYIIFYQTQKNKLDRLYGRDTEMSRGNPFLMDAKGVNTTTILPNKCSPRLSCRRILSLETFPMNNHKASKESNGNHSNRLRESFRTS